MSALAQPVRLIGKVLVALGLALAIALAVAAPIAFSMQLATPLQLLMVAGGGVLVSFAVIRVGDFLADRFSRRAMNLGAKTVLPSTRAPRARSARSGSAVVQPIAPARAQARPL